MKSYEYGGFTTYDEEENGFTVVGIIGKFDNYDEAADEIDIIIKEQEALDKIDRHNRDMTNNHDSYFEPDDPRRT